ncbi:uncharacterized protein LOC135378272 isoform X2 [Ornithodoros turicata]|uniref:uncharacterized protein LOC135378272 isoform X2 n=1 Tax=Ornithodoros turicata TaxID=34597 RepID=UPI00313A2D3E
MCATSRCFITLRHISANQRHRHRSGPCSVSHCGKQILGMVIYSLLWSSPNVLDKFLVTVAFLQWMTGLYIHATIAFCSAGGALRCLLLYLLHHGIGAILYLGGAVTTLVSSLYTNSDDYTRTASGLAIAASGLHFIHATRYLLKHKPQTGAFDPEEHITSGIVIKTKISRFRKRPHQVASVENELTHAVCPEYL